jgi:hypothetical protein
LPQVGAHLAVLGTFLAAITLYVYGTLVVIQLIWSAIEEYCISVEGRTEASLVEFGASVAVVIAAFSLLLVVTHRRPGDHGSSGSE